MRPFRSTEDKNKLYALQREIASRVVLEDRYSLEVVAGVDQAFLKRGEGEIVISGAVAFDSSLRLLDQAHFAMEATFPYIPGLLTFREGPGAMEAVRSLKETPTLLFVDGCGINHPRRAGLATHIGVVLEMPTVGVSKNVLCGSWEPPGQVGEASPLVHQRELVGYVFLSKKKCRPIVVAPGHMVSVESALDLARWYLRNHKLPEPCQMAHQYVNQVKRETIDINKALHSD